MAGPQVGHDLIDEQAHRAHDLVGSQVTPGEYGAEVVDARLVNCPLDPLPDV